jgi:hypothetical protein
MRVISPAVLGDAQIISSNVPETEYATYVAATNYAVGVNVIYAHGVYQSVQTPNVGHTPDSNPLYWTATAPSNRNAMFDNAVGTQTVAAGPLTVVLAPGVMANSLALLELSGASVTVTATDGVGGATIYNKTVLLEESVVTDWYSYFFEPFKPTAQVILTDLPAYSNARITVTIAGGTVRCGFLILGTAYSLGATQYGATAGIIDYSRKTTSTAGVASFTKRAYSKRMSVRMEVDNGALDPLHTRLAGLRATPCLWLGSEVSGYNLLSIYGWYKDFAVDIQYASLSYCSLEIEGLI